MSDSGGLRWPRVRYAEADGVSIAYEVLGDGGIDVVVVNGLMGGLVASVLDPKARAHDERLAAFSRLIRFDRRGQGLSDPVLSGPVSPLEQQVVDIVAVMDAAGSRRAALWAGGDGCQVAMLCAAMHPDRVSALVLGGGWARAYRTDDYPFGADPGGREVFAQQVHDRWGDLDNPWGMRAFGANRVHEPGFRELFAQVQQASASKAAATASFLSDGDVRDVLPLVQAPTLVRCAAEEHANFRGHAEFLAARIPNARLEFYNGLPGYGGEYTAEDYARVEEFLTGTRTAPATERVLATVLFTDIVASTERVAEIGDRSWRGQLDRHDAVVRALLDRFRGREISTAGDSFFATFDGPARAIQCAQAIIEEAATLGIDVRAGVHTGECEVRGDDLAGIAVHIGARVCAMAEAGEVLATSTVRDLVAGSGITFTDRGQHTLKGVPGQWTILAATP